MPITVGTPNGPFVIGPGAFVTAISDLLPLANPPYHWTFTFEAPDSTFLFQHTATTTAINESAQIRVQWTDLDTPSPLLANVHANPGDSIKVTTQVRDDAGATIDGPLIVQVPWQPVAWLHANQFLWADNLVSRLQGGAGGDQLDRIESAVYQVFPHG